MVFLLLLPVLDVVQVTFVAGRPESPGKPKNWLYDRDQRKNGVSQKHETIPLTRGLYPYGYHALPFLYTEHGQV